jgi:predicted nucleic acid-binding protein
MSDSAIRRSMRRARAHGKDRLQPRDRSALRFIERSASHARLLLDSTVYIDDMQGKLSPRLRDLLRVSRLWHSTVTEAELSVLVGALDPSHPASAHAIEQVVQSIERRPDHRIVKPDREIWREAGIAAGQLARLQRYGKTEHRRVLNDALILLSAAKAGLAVLTRNVSDYDFLTQLLPGTEAVFYEI